MGGTAAKRRSLQSGSKVDYVDWQAFRTRVHELRTQHGYSLTRLSLAVGCDRGWLKSALDYPYQLRPREEAALNALYQETLAMPSSKRPRGRPLPDEASAPVLRLLRTIRTRGETYNDIGAGTGVHPAQLGKYVGKRARMSQMTADKIIAYARKKMGSKLVDQAFAEAEARPEAPAVQVEELVPELPQKVAAPRTNGALTFDGVRVSLEVIRAQLEELTLGLPRSARAHIRMNVTGPVEAAIMELSPDGEEEVRA
jgi:hypothetical protein